MKARALDRRRGEHVVAFLVVPPRERIEIRPLAVVAGGRRRSRRE